MLRISLLTQEKKEGWKVRKLQRRADWHVSFFVAMCRRGARRLVNATSLYNR